MAKDLNEFIQANMRYMKLEDGDHFDGFYKGYSVVPNPFQPGKEMIAYDFKYIDSDKIFTWNNATTKIAARMRKFGPNTRLRVTRQGEGTKTDYKIEELPPF